MSNHLALVLFTALATLVLAITAAAGAGYLSRRDGASYPAAITRAAAAFAATVTVTAALVTAAVALAG
ncbi:Integral membrane protein OS=Streptomyces aurantiogriseus OX=66870 GN=GCM10010251_95650 PE=4 SV=1 [Streptomyces aurantiogriseus]